MPKKRKKPQKELPDGYVPINTSQTAFCNADGKFLVKKKHGTYTELTVMKAANKSLSVRIDGSETIAVRYVAIAFCDYKEGQKIEFKDGNKDNIKAENLVLTTKNERRKRRRNLIKQSKMMGQPVRLAPAKVRFSPPKEEIPIEKIKEAAAVRAEKGLEASARFLGVSTWRMSKLFDTRLTKEERNELFGGLRNGRVARDTWPRIFDPESDEYFNPNTKYTNLAFYWYE